MFVWILLLLNNCFALNNFDLDSLYSKWVAREPELDFSYLHVPRSIVQENTFPSLENYQVNSKPASEKTYPWIARVVHSSTKDIPHVCTAVCIERGVFVTAARCIHSLKVPYTNIIYQSKRLPVRAFVLPSKPTKQGFDDIGFIVVEGDYNKWDVISLFEGIERTDEQFKWFKDLDIEGFKVVGYATKKGNHKIPLPERQFNLTEQTVVVGLDICSTILTLNHLIEAFYVPCYHTCTVKQFKNKEQRCNNYHGVEGGVIIHESSNKLFGIATWGVHFFKFELPVGFSVVNSDAFFEDFECARKISNADRMSGGYQKLCANS